MQAEAVDVAVVGGGAIGMACAWEAVRRGLRPCVLDAGDPGAWQVAAGMLAPVAESDFGEQALTELGLRAVERFEPFCAELEHASGEQASLRRSGTLIVARDRDDAEALERLLAYRHALGLAVERLRPSQARRAEPALAPTVRLALDVPGDHSVDPRRLVAALATALRRADVSVRRARVTRVLSDAGRVTGVALEGGAVVVAPRVVLAAGAWSARVDGVPDPVPVRPVKGQILRLRDPRGPGLVERTIRTPQGGYLVPRVDGRYVLGATVEERGYDTAPTAGGVFELVRDLSEVIPGVLELELEEVAAGLRPGSPDNLPSIGRGALDGLVWATGHYRNGILLAPLTAALVCDALAGEEPPEWARPCDPRRHGSAATHAAGALTGSPPSGLARQQ